MGDSFRDLVKRSRSYRRFHEDRRISRETLTGLVDIARFCPCSRNRQPLRYMVTDNPETTTEIRSCLSFALDLPDWGGPVGGEQPAGYITIVTEDECTAFTAYDIGIAAQTMMLAAAGQGIGGCIFGSIQKDRLRSVLSLPDRYEVHLVLAFGYPAEEVILETVGDDGDTNYWRDASGVHHVPKRSLDEVVIQG